MSHCFISSSCWLPEASKQANPGGVHLTCPSVLAVSENSRGSCYLLSPDSAVSDTAWLSFIVCFVIYCRLALRLDACGTFPFFCFFLLLSFSFCFALLWPWILKLMPPVRETGVLKRVFLKKNLLLFLLLGLRVRVPIALHA